MAIVTGVIALLDDFVPVLSLGALYVFAVLPIAILWGLPLAIGVSVASMLVFNFFYLPPDALVHDQRFAQLVRARRVRRDLRRRE